MIINTKQLQDCAKKILNALDNDISSSQYNDLVEISATGNILNLNVTNKEYYVSTSIELETAENFRAVVEAKLFLNLISKLTTHTVELNISDNTLIIKSNGNYKIALIYSGKELVRLPEIAIDNPTLSFKIDSDILLSIVTYNSLEINKNNANRLVQKMYYVDEEGCITFTAGACVNNFKLDVPVKLLLSGKVVKLFKLFKPGSSVDFTLGYDTVQGLITPKVKFETDSIKISALLPSDSSLVESVPVKAIRGRANEIYKYSVSLQRELVLQAINRLLLFNSLASPINKNYGTFKFSPTELTIMDCQEENHESIKYEDGNVLEEYTAYLDIVDLKNRLDSCHDSSILLNFGDNTAFVLLRENIRDVIPELRRDYK